MKLFGNKYFLAFEVAAVIFVNMMATLIPLNGRTTAQISDSLPNLFVPAGYVFSVWGLIYLGLIAVCVSQFMKNPAKMKPTFWEFFFVATVTNILWIIAWHYGYRLASLMVMVALLISLIAMYLQSAGQKKMTRLITVPMSIYLGWISVATIANAAVVFKFEFGFTGAGLSEGVWAGLMILIAGFLAVLILKSHRDWIYSLVILWAVIGILVKNGSDFSIAFSGLIAILMVAAAMFLFLRNIPAKSRR